MTCIIGYIDKNRIAHIAADCLISEKSSINKKFGSKILKFSDDIFLGFAGCRGFQDLIETIMPNIKYSSYEELIQKITNMVGLYNKPISIIAKDSKQISYIISSGSEVCTYSSINLNTFYVAGTGVEFASGAMYATDSESDVNERLAYILKAVSLHYPQLVGPDQNDNFEIYP